MRGAREVPPTDGRRRPRSLPSPAFTARRGMPLAVPHPPAPPGFALRARHPDGEVHTRMPSADRLSCLLLLSHAFRPTTHHCRQSAAVGPMPHHGVAARSPFERALPMSLHRADRKTCGQALLARKCPSATAFFALQLDHLSDFKRRAERKRREVSEPGFGHQDKGLTPFRRQALGFQRLR